MFMDQALEDFGVKAFEIRPFRGSKAPPTIGNDVWLGDAVTLARGVHIGDGAIVGARSVVTKSVEPFCVVAGNPARLIRRRFPDALCERYLSVRWWDYAIIQTGGIDTTDPVGFIARVEDLIGTGKLTLFRPTPLDTEAFLLTLRSDH
jgi:hypothetical protein